MSEGFDFDLIGGGSSGGSGGSGGGSVASTRVIDNLTSNSATDALSAKQGNLLDVAINSRVTTTEYTKLKQLFDLNSLDGENKMHFQHGLHPKYCGRIAKNAANFSPATGFMVSQGINESSGAKWCGDGVTMWSPVDAWHLRMIDEDTDGSSYWMINRSGNVEKPSDIRLKTRFEAFNDVDLAKFNDLFVGTFYWKAAQAKIKEIRLELKNNGSAYTNEQKKKMRKRIARLKRKEQNVGVKAQQIKKVFPFAVNRNKETKMLSIDMDKLNFGLFKVVQQLSVQNADLVKRVEALENA